jgi:hypothetical protein
MFALDSLMSSSLFSTDYLDPIVIPTEYYEIFPSEIDIVEDNPKKIVPSRTNLPCVADGKEAPSCLNTIDG